MNGNTEPDTAQQPTPIIPYDKEAIYTALSNFDESSDEEFQAGLQAIIGPMQASGVEDEHVQETRRRAKVFFWSQRAGVQVDYQDYRAWLTSAQGHTDGNTPAIASAASTTASASEPYPATFDAIVELITTGKTDQIPGIRDIPLKINEESPTEPKLARPSKPWERAATSDQIPTDSTTESRIDPSPTT